MTESMWPTYPKIFTVWPVKGKSSLPPGLDDGAKPAEFLSVSECCTCVAPPMGAQVARTGGGL